MNKLTIPTLVQVLGVLLLVAGWLVAYYGIEYEISKIPPEIRNRMSDTDWVGGSWAVIGGNVSVLGIACFVVGWFRGRRKKESGTKP
jgi:hypothetical protein